MNMKNQFYTLKEPTKLNTERRRDESEEKQKTTIIFNTKSQKYVFNTIYSE